MQYVGILTSFSAFALLTRHQKGHSPVKHPATAICNCFTEDLYRPGLASGTHRKKRG